MCLLLCLFFSLSFAEGSLLTVERIFSNPELDGVTPHSLRFSPNGQRLAFLKGKSQNYEVLDLWEYDLKTGKPRLLVDAAKLKFGVLSEEERARRERMRIKHDGITEYFWSNDATQIVFPAGGDLFMYSPEGKLRRMTESKAAEIDVKFSPKDQYLSFVREQNLHILRLKDAKSFAVTTDGKDAVSNGVAEFIAQEEMGRFTGYWWSDNDQYLAFVRVDESPVGWVERYEIDTDKVNIVRQRYPTAGTANAIVQLGIVRVEDILAGKVTPQWIPLSDNKDIYLPRVKWTPDGQLSYQLQSRDQRTLQLFLYDPVTKTKTLVLTEKDKHWVDLHEDLFWLKKTSQFIWSSERDGNRHIYLFDRKGKRVRQITRGSWPVDRVLSVDEDKGWVYFEAGVSSALERHLYRISLGGKGEPKVLNPEPGWHRSEMSQDNQYFVDYFSTPLNPVQIFLYNAEGEKVSSLSDNEVKEGHPFFQFKKSLIEPEFGSFKTKSGETIYYQLTKPHGYKPGTRYPLVVTGYGGPTAQVVNKSWIGKGDLVFQTLAQRGFMIASFDNRGSARRGKKFANYLDRAFATVEVEDQVAGVRHLVSQGLVNEKRVGFFGWSYGGYLSLMLLAKAPEVFKANVAGAPVVDFSTYDTHYTERYMGKPKNEKAAYKKANVLEFTKNMKGRLLVLHGMADDNVLFTNSTLLFKKLQEQGFLYESITYPGAKHGLSGKLNQTHMYSTVVDFFERNL